MKKLDRLVWTAGFSFRAYGVRVGLRANSDEALKLATDYLPPDTKPAASPDVERLYSFVLGEDHGSKLRRFHMLYANEVQLARTFDLGHVLRSLESDSQFYIAEAAPRRVFVHAGAVGWRGRAVLIPGRSFSGKTTLVAELVRAGAVYYSDEYAVLDANGLVHPYTRPLAIREDGNMESERHSIESLGGVRGKRPLPIALVVVTEYKAGARWRPRRMTAGQGALALLNNSVSIKRRPEAAFPVLKRAASRAPFLKSARGEAKEVVESILAELEKVSS
jgi:serine kinase of HPr protein (carbohydrate metabolism regulator)